MHAVQGKNRSSDLPNSLLRLLLAFGLVSIASGTKTASAVQREVWSKMKKQAKAIPPISYFLFPEAAI